MGPCGCRRHTRLLGFTRDAAKEICLAFGEFADYYVLRGGARPLTREQVLEVLACADAANLVLQPSYSEAVSAICCCGCCCGVLRNLKRQEKPARHVASVLIATLDGETCIHCGCCLEHCQMDALSDAGDRVTLDAGRCIGCGLCVSTCLSGALRLTGKPERPYEALPGSLPEAWKIISEERARQQG